MNLLVYVEQNPTLELKLKLSADFRKTFTTVLVAIWIRCHCKQLASFKCPLAERVRCHTDNLQRSIDTRTPKTLTTMGEQFSYSIALSCALFHKHCSTISMIHSTRCMAISHKQNWAAYVILHLYLGNIAAGTFKTNQELTSCWKSLGVMWVIQ